MGNGLYNILFCGWMLKAKQIDGYIHKMLLGRRYPLENVCRLKVFDFNVFVCVSTTFGGKWQEWGM